MKIRLVVFHHPESHSPPEIFSHLNQHFELIWLLPEKELDHATIRFCERSGAVLAASGLDPSEIANRLRPFKPDGAISFVDPTLRLCTEVALQLGLATNSRETCSIALDKYRQRKVFRDAGLPGPSFCLLRAGQSSQEIVALTRNMRWPLVLKLRCASASRGMHLVTDQHHLASLWGNIQGSDWLVEEYLGNPSESHLGPFGDYVSVESIVARGEIHHAVVTGRFPLASRFRETGNFMPSPLTQEDEAAVAALAEAAIRASGIETGAAHTEIKLTETGPSLIELNGRLGGRPPVLLSMVKGSDLFLAAAQAAVGQKPGVVPLQRPKPCPFWWMLQPPEGAVAIERIDRLEDVARLSCVKRVIAHSRPGDPIELAQGTFTRILSVIGVCENLDQLAQIPQLIMDRLAVTWRYGGADFSFSA